MFVLSITLRSNNDVIVEQAKEINTNDLDSLITELKIMQSDMNGLLTNMIAEPDGKEMGVDDEDEESENESLTTAFRENGINSQKRPKDVNRGSKKRKKCA